MTPPKLTARRLLGAGALFAGLGVFGAAFAAPAGADALVWGTAQARVAGGDLLAGHATATSFGDDIEDTAATGVLLGPLADYAVVTGEAGASVDADGAHATTTLDSATVRLGAADLVDLGLVEAPEGWAPVSTAADPDGNADDGSDTTGEPEATASPAPEATPTAADPTAGPSDTPSGLPDGARSGDGTAPDMGSPTAGAEPSASPSTSGDGAVHLDETDSEPLSGTADTVGFSLSDVVSTASAGFDGRTEASLEYGNLTASGVELEGVEDTENGYVVDDSVAFLDADGSVIEEVGVSVGIAINEATFEDEDEGWDGRGVRSWLTVWVQVGEADEEDGDRLVVDFAETRVLGSTHDPATSPTPDPTPDPTSSATPTPSPKPTPTEDPSDRRLATTGGSLAALVVAAVVAVGGGTTATFLARKRTTAMDDRIGD